MSKEITTIERLMVIKSVFGCNHECAEFIMNLQESVEGLAKNNSAYTSAYRDILTTNASLEKDIVGYKDMLNAYRNEERVRNCKYTSIGGGSCRKCGGVHKPMDFAGPNTGGR